MLSIETRNLLNEDRLSWYLKSKEAAFARQQIKRSMESALWGRMQLAMCAGGKKPIQCCIWWVGIDVCFSYFWISFDMDSFHWISYFIWYFIFICRFHKFDSAEKSAMNTYTFEYCAKWRNLRFSEIYIFPKYPSSYLIWRIYVI